MAAIIDYRGKTPPKTTSGVPLITAKIIKGGRIEKPEEFIDPAYYDEWMRRGIPKAGDVVLTTEAPLGEVAQLDGSKVALSQRVITLRGRKGVFDNTFLKFLLQSKGVQGQLHGRSTGTTVHGIRQSELRKVLLPVPPFAEQRAIAHILGTLDDKIELNRRMNETLEAMARALFKSWFVDFDPVRAKANLPSPSGRGAGGEGHPCPSHTYPPTELRDFARTLRNNQTDAEHLMWRMLRDRRIAGAKFRRQHPVPPYVLDFYCHELKLAIELDGGQHGEPTGCERDRQRDAALSERGITVLRFWNNEVLTETEAVLEQIYRTVTERALPSPPTPLPEGEGLCDLPKEIADLFPDSFEESELGEIPKGWEVAELSDIADVVDCLHAKKPERCEKGHPFLQLTNIRDNGLVDMENTYFIDESDYHKWVSRMEATKGDCVITNVGRVGAVAQIPDGLKAALGRNMTGIRCKSAYRFPTFLIECLLSDSMRAEITRKMDAGTILNALNVRNIPRLRFVLADARVMGRFEQISRPLRQKMEQNLLECRTLAALRDTLLPKLISGDLRVEPRAAQKGAEST
jgi:very-short-patch-repair endonuclease/restriction endonuclease S subunit